MFALSRIRAEPRKFSKRLREVPLQTKGLIEPAKWLFVSNTGGTVVDIINHPAKIDFFAVFLFL